MKSYTFPYDLDTDMRLSPGELRFSEDGTITCASGGQELYTLNAAEFAEITVIAGVGCGLLCAVLKKPGDVNDAADDVATALAENAGDDDKETEQKDERLLCRFSMSALKDAGEFAKIVNFYISSGKAYFPAEKEVYVCETCGRPLAEGMKICVFCYNKVGLLKRAFGLMKPFAKSIICAELALTVSSLLYLLVPLFSRYLIDEYLELRIGTAGEIIFLAALMFAARALGEGVFILSSRVFNKASILYANHLRTLAYGKIQKLSMSSLSKRTPGDLIRRVMEDTTTIKDFMSDGGRWAIDQFIMFIVVLVILLSTEWKLTILVFLPVPVVCFALGRFWRFIHIRFERQWRKNSKCQSILHDIIKGIRTVKSFGNEDIEIKKFSNAAHELASVSSDNESLWSRLFPTVTFFSGIGEFLVLYFGARAILGGELSIGTLAMFTMYIGYIYGPLRWMVSFPRWLADAMTSMVKVFEILDEEPDIYETKDPVNTPVSGEVSLESVSFGYKSYEPVLKDVAVDIKPGEMVGIVGRSGTGKSTMINLIMRLYDPNAGKVTIGGTDLRDMSPRHLHENIGVVFQDSFLFAGTIYDNIAYGKPDATAEEVIAAAKAANAHDFIMATADGYNTYIGESGHSLSGGERQRLSIARAVIKNPDILILDEATSSLDVETEASIQDSLSRLTKGRTTVAIAHRLSTLRSADRLIILDKGKVAESGTHMELLKKKGIYYKLVMAQRQTSKS